MVHAPLPSPRGPISLELISALREGRPVTRPDSLPIHAVADPIADDDLQLALYVCFELHYRRFAGVEDDREWDPTVLALRGALESRMTGALTELVPMPSPDAPVDLAAMIDAFDGPSLSTHVAEHATVDQFREFLVHRAPYQLKEADPHSWGLPRLAGRAKAALVEIQMDEYGNGTPGLAHAELFAETLTAAGLDATYGLHVDAVPGITLATTNLISLFGLHRHYLPALLGHLAVFEMTSVTPMSRYAAAARRFGLGETGARFYEVHVEADAVHQVVAEEALIGSYVADDPAAGPLVTWGAATLMAVENRFARHLLDSWAAGTTSLRGPGALGRLRVPTADQPTIDLDADDLATAV
ncbi:MAG: iron-containing redox enzyme family protein [Acidimicrobiales bacterium]